MNIKSTVERIAQEAHRGCGLSHTVYVQNFSGAIDRFISTLDAATKHDVMREAKMHDYASKDEINEMMDELLADGWCKHGIDPDCCPAGCGEF